MKGDKCSKCNGTRWFQYDHNHSQVCDSCCKHNKGVWILLEHYGENNGKMCCLNGCGTTFDIQGKYFLNLGDKYED